MVHFNLFLAQHNLKCLESKLKVSLNYHMVTYRAPNQWDQIGPFLKSLGGKVTLKSSQNLWWVFGPMWNASFFNKTTLADFWATFGKTRATFYFNIWSHCPQLPFQLKKYFGGEFQKLTLHGLPHWIRVTQVDTSNNLQYDNFWICKLRQEYFYKLW